MQHLETTVPRKQTPFSCMKLLADITTISGIIICLVLIVGYSVDLYRHGKQKLLIGWFSSAGFVLLTIPISMRIIVQHLTHWVAPNVQKYIVRIVWMVPIYAVESWIALRFKFMANYLEKLRECYEAYVIFCFMYYLIALLGGDEQQIAFKLRKQAAEIGKQSWFSVLVGTKPTGAELLRRCKFGVFQYVMVKNLMAILACILQSQGLQREGDFSFSRGYIYQCFVTNISQLWALYCLVVFYVATRDELAHWRPVGKFLCVKSVVFFTWWQSICIEIFFATKRGYEIANNTEDSWTVNEISKGLQDYLICIEMFFASIAFTIAFSYKDYDNYKFKKHHSNETLRSNSSSRDDLVDVNMSVDDDDEPEETKPFLSAFFQSSIPDDIVTDFRKLAKFQHLLPWWTATPGAGSMSNNSSHSKAGFNNSNNNNSIGDADYDDDDLTLLTNNHNKNIHTSSSHHHSSALSRHSTLSHHASSSSAAMNLSSHSIHLLAKRPTTDPVSSSTLGIRASSPIVASISTVDDLEGGGSGLVAIPSHNGVMKADNNSGMSSGRPHSSSTNNPLSSSSTVRKLFPFSTSSSPPSTTTTSGTAPEINDDFFHDNKVSHAVPMSPSSPQVDGSNVTGISSPVAATAIVPQALTMWQRIGW